MRKSIKGMAAFSLIAALTIPMAALADTIITPTGGDPFDVTPNQRTAESSVEFTVNPAYTVTIPAKIALESNEEGIYSNSGTVRAEDVFLAEGKELSISLTSASEFNMKVSGETEYQLPYTTETEKFGKLTDKSAGGVIATFANSKEVQTVDVTFTTDEETQYAGSYSDPVVFTIEVKDVAASRS